MTWLSTLGTLAGWTKQPNAGASTIDESARIIGACLRAHEVTAHLSQSDRERLGMVFEWRSVGASEPLVEEGDPDDDRLYLLDSGTVRVERSGGPNDASRHVLARFGARCCVGEVSFLSGRPRTASIIATSPVRALVASRARFDALLAEEPALQRRVLDSLRLCAIDKLTSANDHALDAAQQRVRFSHFIVLVMILLVIQNFLTGAFEHIVAQVPVYVFSLGGIGFAALVGTLVMPRIVGQPLATFGLSLAQWRPALRDGLLLGALGCAGAILLFPATDYLAFFLDYLRSPTALLYLVSVFLQELVFRGMFVTTLRVFFHDSRGLRSVALSSLVFASMHVPFGWALTALTFVGGIVFGLVYLRHRTLVGVCTVHFILGSLALGAQLMQ